MLQRSTHEAAVDVPDIPATVQPGDTVDWPIPIAGFEPVEDEAPKTARKKATSADAASTGEEPQK
ncbi:hypothetical protein [Streptomyces sp. NPDC051994]|uniref:hypothetical protein n=1 Tax=unclassified Streptomyces TaxID=2593676 RepID=UPI0034209DC5